MNGDSAGARRLLEQVLAVDPANVRAQSLLSAIDSPGPQVEEMPISPWKKTELVSTLDPTPPDAPKAPEAPKGSSSEGARETKETIPAVPFSGLPRASGTGHSAMALGSTQTSGLSPAAEPPLPNEVKRPSGPALTALIPPESAAAPVSEWPWESNASLGEHPEVTAPPEPDAASIPTLVTQVAARAENDELERMALGPTRTRQIAIVVGAVALLGAGGLFAVLRTADEAPPELRLPPPAPMQAAKAPQPVVKPRLIPPPTVRKGLGPVFETEPPAPSPWAAYEAPEALEKAADFAVVPGQLRALETIELPATVPAAAPKPAKPKVAKPAVRAPARPVNRDAVMDPYGP